MGQATPMIRELLNNGVHFGHQTNKWNPKMKKYIFGAKSGIYILDLEKTEMALLEAMSFVQQLAEDNKKVLFVGTKKQAKQIIKNEAERCGMYYIDERWLGGCLTNHATIKKSVDRLDNIQAIKASETYNDLAKKERVKMDRVENKLLKNLKGIRDMTAMPAAVILVDADAEKIAVKEAVKLGIPVVAIIDTNCDPDEIDYPIPGNDDAIRSIQYICSTLADSILKGKGEYVEKPVVPVVSEEEKEVPAEEAQVEPVAVEVVKEEAAVKVVESAKEEAPVAEESVATVEKEEAPVKETVEEPAVEEKKEEEKKEESAEPADEKEIDGDISL
jgi:small subunit ribosomal protein S2